jgi:hypothetical protein
MDIFQNFVGGAAGIVTNPFGAIQNIFTGSEEQDQKSNFKTKDTALEEKWLSAGWHSHFTHEEDDGAKIFEEQVEEKSWKNRLKTQVTQDANSHEAMNIYNVAQEVQEDNDEFRHAPGQKENKLRNTMTSTHGLLPDNNNVNVFAYVN